MEKIKSTNPFAYNPGSEERMLIYINDYGLVSLKEAIEKELPLPEQIKDILEWLKNE